MAQKPHMFDGPLRVCRSNPRYFADASGKAVYLTGAHTWANFQDIAPQDPKSPPRPFDYDAYLDFAKGHHLNLVRLWHWEFPRWTEGDGSVNLCAPQPWLRIGPGLAHDGKPEFDLTRFDPAYFDRLRRRVVAAHDRGLYVSVMLFEGWGMQFFKHPWPDHPFAPGNHLPNLAGFPPADAQGVEIFEMKYPAVTAVQEAYVRHVIDTVGDLDNVLYEVSNENHGASTDWQYHFIRYVKGYEATRKKQHPIGMSFQYYGGANAALFNSPADWVGPGEYVPSDAPKPLVPDDPYRDDPPAADGRKVVIIDSDHIFGEGGDNVWVWKSFLRGLNTSFMDRIAALTGAPDGDTPTAEGVRLALGDTRRYAERMDLTRMTPQNALASTGYCLASRGHEYLVYQPGKDAFTVTLDEGRYTADWFSVGARKTLAGGERTVAGTDRTRFAPPAALPSSGGFVLHLKRR